MTTENKLFLIYAEIAKLTAENPTIQNLKDKLIAYRNWRAEFLGGFGK